MNEISRHWKNPCTIRDTAVRGSWINLIAYLFFLCLLSSKHTNTTLFLFRHATVIYKNQANEPINTKASDSNVYLFLKITLWHNSVKFSGFKIQSTLLFYNWSCHTTVPIARIFSKSLKGRCIVIWHHVLSSTAFFSSCKLNANVRGLLSSRELGLAVPNQIKPLLPCWITRKK